MWCAQCERLRVEIDWRIREMKVADGLQERVVERHHILKAEVLALREALDTHQLFHGIR
jgi:hypothetical protein